MVLMGLTYFSEFLKAKKNGVALLSLVVAVGGFTLAYLAYQALGPDLTYFGRQFGVVEPVTVTEFPYGTSEWQLIVSIIIPSDLTFLVVFAVPHPMTTGALIGLIGLRMHPTYGPRFDTYFKLNVALYMFVLFLELTDLHVPSSITYHSTYQEFIQFHQVGQYRTSSNSWPIPPL